MIVWDCESDRRYMALHTTPRTQPTQMVLAAGSKPARPSLPSQAASSAKLESTRCTEAASSGKRSATCCGVYDRSMEGPF